jgi:hypothetical protein
LAGATLPAVADDVCPQAASRRPAIIKAPASTINRFLRCI